MSDIIKETASAGSTSASSIAVNVASGSSGKSRLLTFMSDFYKRVKNRGAFKPVLSVEIKENFNLNDVLSRLSSTEKLNTNTSETSGGTTFGLEDDEGNLMKVTVRTDQANDFEREVALELNNIKTEVNSAYASTDNSGNMITRKSLAELLYDLSKKFDILDVEFPKIPTDVIYNADKASYNVPNDLDTNFPQGDNELPMDLNQMDELEDELNAMDSSESETTEDDLEAIDDESVETVEDEVATDEGSYLQQIIGMLKAQAESEKAKADAEAEKARAEQAKYTAQAAAATIRNKEEEMRYELEMEEQKKREKDARRLADMAKHKVAQSMGLREFDEMDTVSGLRRQRALIAQKFKIEATDDPATKNYKNTQRTLALRELDTKIRQAVTKDNYIKKREKEEGDINNISPEKVDKKPAEQNQQQNNTNNNNTNNTLNYR